MESPGARAAGGGAVARRPAHIRAPATRKLFSNKKGKLGLGGSESRASLLYLRLRACWQGLRPA